MAHDVRNQPTNQETNAHLSELMIGVIHDLPQPCDLESELSLRSIIVVLPIVLKMAWHDWLRQTRSVPWCGPTRPTRAATDCSGLGIPELALIEIAKHYDSSVDLAWSCDVASSSKRWCLVLEQIMLCLESRAAMCLGRVCQSIIMLISSMYLSAHTLAARQTCSKVL